MQGNNAFSMIRCRVADKVYGLAMDYIRSIEQTERVSWETADSGFLGTLHTTHETIPVLDVGARLGQPLVATAEDQRLIVLEGKRPFALLVDEVSPTLVIDAERLLPMPAAIIDDQNDFFEGLIRFDNDFVPLLAPAQLHPTATPRRYTLPNRPNMRQRPRASSQVYQPQLVVFTVPNMPNGFSLALSLSQVPEISDVPLITPIPQASNVVMGLANWHRQPVTVLDLGCYWQPDQPVTDFEELRLMIVRTAVKDLHLGLLINANVRLLRLPLPHRPLPPTRPNLDPALIRGRIEFEGEQLVIPDMVKLLHVIRRKAVDHKQ